MTAGVKGAHVTIGKNGTRTTIGLPGSGVSYTHVDKAQEAKESLGLPGPIVLVWAIALAIFIGWILVSLVP